MLSFLTAALVASTAAIAHPVNEDFYQPRDSPTAQLFQRRAISPSDSNFTSNYPAGSATPPASMLPQAWKDKLASITLPDVPVSNPNNGYPTYSNGKAGSDPSICSFTYACTTSDDLYNAPDGIWALTFDDGPGQASPDLYTFLQQNNISSSATHFMIGGNILYSPTVMQSAANAGGHIAVHTWSHPYMTSLSNEDVLSELGWTTQIISDLNGGRVPRYWRPPYGDVDNRIRAIAKGVFGLETVVWNQDTGDWAIGSNAAYTQDSVKATMNGWFTGTKSPGVLSLEHELDSDELAVFEYAYPIAKANGWKVLSVPDAWGMPWYANSASNTAAVTSLAVGSGPGSSATASGNSSMSMTSSNGNSSSSTSSAPASSSSMSLTSSLQSRTLAQSSSQGATTAAAAAAASTSVKSAAGRVAASYGFSLSCAMGLAVWAVMP